VKLEVVLALPLEFVAVIVPVVLPGMTKMAALEVLLFTTSALVPPTVTPERLDKSKLVEDRVTRVPMVPDAGENVTAAVVADVAASAESELELQLLAVETSKRHTKAN
jgi:hypothetical protein